MEGPSNPSVTLKVSWSKRWKLLAFPAGHVSFQRAYVVECDELVGVQAGSVGRDRTFGVRAGILVTLEACV